MTKVTKYYYIYTSTGDTTEIKQHTRFNVSAVASEASTTLTAAGQTHSLNYAGDYTVLQVPSTSFLTWESDKPIMLVQFVQSQVGCYHFHFSSALH